MPITEQELFNVQPESYQGRYDIPIVVNPRIPLTVLFRALGVRELISSENFINTPPPVSNIPYLIWIAQESRHSEQSVEDVKAKLQSDETEVSVNLIELAAVYLGHPEFFIRRALIAGESSYGEYNPYISTFAKQPELFVVRPNFRLARYEVLTRGRIVRELGF